MASEDVLDRADKVDLSGAFGWKLTLLRELREALRAEISARIEAESLAVWAVRKGANFHDSILELNDGGGGYEPTFVKCDGTDADIPRALREAGGIWREG